MHINRKLLHLSRTVHIYLTMLGLFVMLLFGITGFTINHEDWFNATTPQVTETKGQTPPDLVAKQDALRIVEHLRSTYHVTGALVDFAELEDKFSLSFKEPGSLWEIEIDRPSGVTRLHAEAYNFTALVNNLHRGRYSGPGWRWVIDLAAIFIALACATGIILWLALPKRRQLGLVAFAAGVLTTMAVFHWLVPGPDTTNLPLPAAENTPATQK